MEPEDDRRERFERWVVPEIDVMYRVAMSLTHDHAEAEDVVQDALVRAYRAIDRFDGRHPRAWLLTIVRNTRINRIRRRRPELLRDPDATMERLADGGGPGAGAGGLGTEELVVDEGFDDRVERAYRELPERFRSVVDLVDLGGRSYQEAADALGIPVGTVMSRLHRARRRMRDQLEADGVEVRLGVVVEREGDR